jgi:uncharacterized protein (DUF2147 family)
MKIVIAIIILMIQEGIFAQDVVGYWKSVNAEKGFTTSVVAVYEYQGKIYGQLVVTYDEKTGTLIDTVYAPVQKAGTVKDKPFLVKICIFWNLEKKGTKYKGGTVLDPRTGMTFACELWVNTGLLMIRGLVGPFGMNEIFYPAGDADFPPGFDKPPLSSLIPVLP